MIDKDTLKRFNQLLNDKFLEIQGGLRRDRRGDRGNVSAHWNRYLGQLGATVMRGKTSPTRRSVKEVLFDELVNKINFKHESVSDHVVSVNPDRPEQLILVPRDVVSRALVLGLP